MNFAIAYMSQILNKTKQKADPAPPSTLPWLFVPQTGHNRLFLEQKYTALNVLPHVLRA